MSGGRGGLNDEAADPSTNSRLSASADLQCIGGGGDDHDDHDKDQVLDVRYGQPESNQKRVMVAM